MTLTCTNTTCTQGDVRLQGGSANYKGRVEICNENVWGEVCLNSWGIPDAQVTCRQLGFQFSSTYVNNTDYEILCLGAIY